MVSAVVLMQVNRGKVQATAEIIAAMEGVSEVFSVGGQYDLVALVRARSNEELADVVTSKLALIDDIAKTETLIAFKAFSKHDLERMFSIGFENPRAE